MRGEKGYRPEDFDPGPYRNRFDFSDAGGFRLFSKYWWGPYEVSSSFRSETQSGFKLVRVGSAIAMFPFAMLELTGRDKKQWQIDALAGDGLEFEMNGVPAGRLVAPFVGSGRDGFALHVVGEGFPDGLRFRRGGIATYYPKLFIGGEPVMGQASGFVDFWLRLVRVRDPFYVREDLSEEVRALYFLVLESWFGGYFTTEYRTVRRRARELRR